MNNRDVVNWLGGYVDGIEFAIDKLLSAADSEEAKQDPEPQQDPKKTETKKIEKAAANQNVRKVDKGKVIALHNAGWKPKAISEEMGISEASVYNVIKKLEESQGKEE